MVGHGAKYHLINHQNSQKWRVVLQSLDFNMSKKFDLKVNLSITAGVCANVPAFVVVVAGFVNVAAEQLNHIVVSGALLASSHLVFISIKFILQFLP